MLIYVSCLFVDKIRPGHRRNENHACEIELCEKRRMLMTRAVCLVTNTKCVVGDVKNVQERNKSSIIDIKVLDEELLRGGDP